MELERRDLPRLRRPGGSQAERRGRPRRVSSGATRRIPEPVGLGPRRSAGPGSRRTFWRRRRGHLHRALSGDRRVKAKQIEVPAFNAPWATDWQWFLDKSEVDLTRRGASGISPTGSKSRVLKASGWLSGPSGTRPRPVIVGKGQGL